LSNGIFKDEMRMHPSCTESATKWALMPRRHHIIEKRKQ